MSPREPLYTRSFILLACANLFMVSSIGTFYLFPLFITNYGGDKTDIGILMGTMSLTAVFFRPAMSYLVDRFGRKKGYSFGTALMAGVSLVYLLFQGNMEQTFFPLLMTRVIHGFAAGVCFTSAYAYAADIVPASRLNEGIGAFGITGLVGMALGPFLAEVVIHHFGFSGQFIASALLCLIGVALLQPLIDTYQGSSREKSVSFSQVLFKPKMLIVVGLTIFFGVGLAGSSNYVSPFCQEIGLKMISLFFISYSAAAVSTRLFGGRLADTVGEIRVIPWALFTTGLGLMMLIYLDGPVLLVLSGLVTGTGHGFLFPTLSALALRNEPEHTRGKVSGIFTGGMDAGLFTGAIALGAIGDWGGYQIIFLVAGVSLWMGLGLFKFSGVQKHYDLA